MRYGITATSLSFLCIIAAMIFGSTFWFARDNVAAEPLRLISVALVGCAFYLRQNARLNELEQHLRRTNVLYSMFSEPSNH